MEVSVIIPAYNCAAFLERAILSVYAQGENATNLEVIVVDDGSMDETAAILAKLSAQYPLRLITQPNLGKAAATSVGIGVANGDIIFNLDADDWFLPGKIKATIEIFRKYAQVVHVASPASIRWDDGSRNDEIETLPAWLTGKPLKGNEVLRRFMEQKMLFGGGSTFAARASVLKYMAFPAEVDMYTDEWLVIQVLLAGETFFIPEPLSVWRLHTTNYSVQAHGLAGLSARNKRLEASSLEILNKLQTGIYPTWLQRTYRLKHETRCMAWKEQQGTKTLKDRFHYLFHCMFTGAYPVGWWFSYRIFNRVIK
jgi:glycosyltransferase involved in cell wall biosynthesis